MPIGPNAIMKLIDYAVEDVGVRVHFHCPNPGGGQDTEWYLFISDVDFKNITNQNQLNTVMIDGLKRMYRAQGFGQLDTAITATWSTVI